MFANRAYSSLLFPSLTDYLLYFFYGNRLEYELGMACKGVRPVVDFCAVGLHGQLVLEGHSGGIRLAERKEVLESSDLENHVSDGVTCGKSSLDRHGYPLYRLFSEARCRQT